jgi:hypothetical protein
MDETQPTSAPASTSRDRRSGTIRSIARALLLALLMAGCTLSALPLVLSFVQSKVGVGQFVLLTSFLATIFLVFFALLILPWFGFDEWARRRGRKQALVDLRPFFRPVARMYSWWCPFRLGRLGEAVLLPDPMAILGAVVVLAWLSAIVSPLSFFWLYLPLLGPALVVSPFVLTAVLWVSREEVRLIRFFFVIPYWVHRVPDDAQFGEFWALEDPAPSGVAFTSRSSIGYELHLGTSTSALRLCRHISDLLERASPRGA